MRSRSSLLRLFAVALTAIVLGVACGAEAGPAATIDAPVWSFDGELVNLAELTGTPMVVNFFAKSCPPCVAEMPMFESVSQDLGPKIRFVGVSEDINQTAAEDIIGATGITYISLWDRDGSALSTFEAFALPATIFVAADGRIIESHTGVLNEDQLRSKIDELVAA